MARLHTLACGSLRTMRLCARTVSLTLFVSFVDVAIGANGPYLVKDINPTSYSMPTYLTKVGNRLFFNASDGVHGPELWVSDGTEAGTYMVIDLIPGPAGSNPQVLIDVNGRCFFQGVNSSSGLDLYVSDGTASGTHFVVNATNYAVVPMAALGDLVMFVRKESGSESLWKSNGTPQGTGLVKSMDVNQMEPIGNLLYIAGVANGEVIPGFDLWRSDATLQGTYLLADLRGTIWVTEAGETIFFQGDLSATGRELWSTDGTPNGTHLVKDIYTGAGHSEPVELTDVAGTLFFTAFTPALGRELWKSAGTEQGTVLVKDVNPSGNPWAPTELTNMEGTLIFRAYDPALGWQVWKSDGTEAGTVLVKTIAPPDVTDYPRYFTYANGKVYFEGSDGIHGAEPWVTDGTAEGTFMVADVNPGPAGSGFEPTLVGSLLFFMGGNNSTGAELWALDTTPPLIPAVSGYGITAITILILTCGTLVIARRSTT